MSSILVTGGAGFIGSNLCESLLTQGHKVINLDNFNDSYNPLIKRKNVSTAIQNANYKLVQGDINEEHLLEEIFTNHSISTVIHLAALAGVRQSIEKPLNYIDVDIKGTVNLLQFASKYKVKKFIFASSSSVYGRSKPPFKESDTIRLQVSPYAAAKMAGETFCRTYNELYGIPIIVLRFFTVYGPRQRPEMAIHSFVRSIDEELEIPVFGDGSSTRDYTYIDDVIQGIIAALDYDCSFEIFNLGNASSVCLNDLINGIEAKLGKTAKRKHLQSQLGDVEITFADITKSEQLLGFNPKIKIEEGLEKFVKWYKANCGDWE